MLRDAVANQDQLLYNEPSDWYYPVRESLGNLMRSVGLNVELFASAGYAAVAPDYLGLGTGPGLHPYMDLSSEVTASVDMLDAGRRYRRQDEVGTPFCVTVDGDTISQGTVTVRERDSMAQEKVAADQLIPYLAERLA